MQHFIKIDTSAGQLSAWKDDKSNQITVDMGRPEFQWDKIPLLENLDNILNRTRIYLGRLIYM